MSSRIAGISDLGNRDTQFQSLERGEMNTAQIADDVTEVLSREGVLRRVGEGCREEEGLNFDRTEGENLVRRMRHGYAGPVR